MWHEPSDRTATGRHFPDLRVAQGSLGKASWVVTTRWGGHSSGFLAESNLAEHVADEAEHVRANREGLRQALGASKGLAVIRAEHGRRLTHVTVPGDVPSVDAIVTSVPGLGLVALGADCAIVGLVGKGGDGLPMVAAVHCGWKGLVVDVVGASVATLLAGGARSVSAIVGPTICGRCYRVSDERIDRVLAECEATVTQAAITGVRGDFGLDIGAGVVARLTDLDVHVEAPFGCTYEEDQWFSFRRAVDEGVPDGQTGRQGLGIVIT